MSTQARSLRKAKLLTPYVVVWLMLASLSAGYIAILGFAPDWLDDLRTGPRAVLADNPSMTQRFAGDLSGVKGSLAQIQADLEKVKTDVASGEDRDRSIKSELDALRHRVENSPPGTVEASAPQPAPTPPPTATASEPNVINAPAAPVPAQTAAASLETGSIEKLAETSAPIVFGPAVVKPAPKPVGIKIGSGPTLDSLRLSWSLLTEKNAEALKNTQPRFAAAGDPANPAYDLIAGPMKSRAQAVKVCKLLAVQNVPCKVGDYAGEAL